MWGSAPDQYQNLQSQRWATGIAAYPRNGGVLEEAAQMVNRASTRTPRLYIRLREELSVDDVVKIRVGHIAMTAYSNNAIWRLPA
jgi:hypothetical protein